MNKDWLSLTLVAYTPVSPKGPEMEGMYDSGRPDLRYLVVTATSGDTCGRRRRLCLCDVFSTLMNADFQLGLVLAPLHI